MLFPTVFPPQCRQVDKALQQVCTRHEIIEVERVEELVLPAVKLPHHDDALPSIDIYQDTEISEIGENFSTQSANNGHSVVVIGPVADGAESTLRLWRIEKRPYPLAVLSRKLPA